MPPNPESNVEQLKIATKQGLIVERERERSAFKYLGNLSTCSISPKLVLHCFRLLDYFRQ